MSDIIKIEHLLDGFLQISRLEAEMIHLEPVAASLKNTIISAVNSIYMKAYQKNISIELNEFTDLEIPHDPHWTQEALVNVLDNAVKYSDEGGQIIASFTKLKNVVKFTVRNTTESISVDHVEHIFDRFYRMDRSRNSQTGGYGLGLSIAAAIVNTHKGKIVAETKDGKYLLITVILPIG